GRRRRRRLGPQPQAGPLRHAGRAGLPAGVKTFAPVHGVSRGILLRIASAGCFSLMAAMMKYAATLEPVSAPEMVFYRALFGLPVVLVWVMTGPGLSAIKTRRPHVHLWRCALGVTGILLIFQTLRMLPLADATTIGFTAPIFAT